MADALAIETRHGRASVLVHRAAGSGSVPPTGTVLLGHGAGGGVRAPDLVALAAALPAHGWRVVLVEQPWRVAGRRVAPRAGVLDESWVDVVTELRRTEDLLGLLVVGGRSAGARVACRTAAATRADAVLALAFPLHPPWRPEATRRPELEAAGCPVLVVQGTRDEFGGPGDLGPGPYEVVAVPEADHSFAVSRAAGGTRAALASVVRTVLPWLDRIAAVRTDRP